MPPARATGPRCRRKPSIRVPHRSASSVFGFVPVWARSIFLSVHSASALLPHCFRSVPELLPHCFRRFRTSSAVDLDFFRSGSELLPQWFCTSSAAVSGSSLFFTSSALLPNCCSFGRQPPSGHPAVGARLRKNGFRKAKKCADMALALIQCCLCVSHSPCRSVLVV